MIAQTIIGQTVKGKYLITERIDSGGMGSVYKGKDLAVDRLVAVKVINPDLAGSPEVVMRFRSEARSLAALNHPNVAMLYSLEEEDGAVFLIMEFVHGRDLHWLIDRGGATPIQVAIPLFCGILDGFGAIHKANIVHRDIKPTNVIVTADGCPKVIDFGISRIQGGDGLTRVAQTLGTPAYMSPEQIDHAPLDVRSDLYSLGIVLFELIAGRQPFEGSSDFSIWEGHKYKPPPRLADLIGKAPAEVEEVVVRALAKKPGERFQSAQEFRKAVSACLPVATQASAEEVMKYVREVMERFEEHPQLAAVSSGISSTRPSSPDLPATRYEPQVVAPTGRSARNRFWFNWKIIATAIVCAVTLAAMAFAFRLHSVLRQADSIPPPSAVLHSPPGPPPDLMMTTTPVQTAPPKATVVTNSRPVPKATAPPSKSAPKQACTAQEILIGKCNEKEKR